MATGTGSSTPRSSPRKIRKVTGDLGANGFLQSQRRIPDSLGQTLEQRTERGVAMEGQWGRQSTQHARPRHRDDAAHVL